MGRYKIAELTVSVPRSCVCRLHLQFPLCRVAITIAHTVCFLYCPTFDWRL